MGCKRWDPWVPSLGRESPPTDEGCDEHGGGSQERERERERRKLERAQQHRRKLVLKQPLEHLAGDLAGSLEERLGNDRQHTGRFWTDNKRKHKHKHKQALSAPPFAAGLLLFANPRKNAEKSQERWRLKVPFLAEVFRTRRLAGLCVSLPLKLYTRPA